jgi:hypothetical protein
VTGVDADFDDNVGRVELQFDLRVQINATTGITEAAIAGVGFQVLILTA